MTTDENKLTKLLFTTSMALNIIMVTATLFTMYRKTKAKKKCNCKPT